MRKSILPTEEAHVDPPAWLDLGGLAHVEVSSEDSAHPVEDALIEGSGSGWRASAPGPQTLRLRFDEPQRVRRIRLRFTDPEHERRQEFVLRWSADGRAFRDIVRQQWNFSPSGATSEAEDYAVDLDGVRALELCITPDMSGGEVRASLAELRLAG